MAAEGWPLTGVLAALRKRYFWKKIASRMIGSSFEHRAR